MLWLPWGIRDRADRKHCWLVEHAEAALVTRRDSRHNHSRLALEALRTAIDHRFQRLWDIRVDHINQSRVHPSSSLDGV
jgi:hypothetical protein